MNDILNFCNVMKDITRLLDSVISLENKKLEFIAANNITELDVIMKEEQAIILQFRGLEKKREQVQVDLGLSSLTFREMIEQSPSPNKETLSRVYQEMNEKMKEVKAVTDCTKKYIELHLHSLDLLITNLQNGKSNINYNKTGEKQPREMSPKFTRIKI
ncbi:flagellar protein FlgN [Anaerovorax sp. IOR16]|uniref:flagellar protein FlgN n=1 Tax=Anaerovorax sp. IOR16 TaxID=2773458 RepID=UPI0019D0D4BB|nr:flagellar protein FlgN [Anaerovorax sp. IOR16]